MAAPDRVEMTRTFGAETPEQLLHRLEWQVIRRLDGLLQGRYRTAFRGVGLDFMDLREYEPGDDVRHIDWNVTARMDALFVRQYSEDRELTAWLLLDRSPSMGFGPIDRPKEVVLGELATTFARLLTRSGNRVGAVLFDNEIEETLPPRSTRNQVLALARNLLRAPRVNGTVTDLKVSRSLDPNFGLDEEAIKAARQWRFKPATRNNQPIAVYVTIGVSFSMR